MAAERSESVLAKVKNNLTLLDEMLSDRPHEWEGWLSTARSAMSTIDAIHFFRDTGRLQEQTWLIQILQDYAFHDADEGCIRDIAEWCQASWLRILRDHTDDATILNGTFTNHAPGSMVLTLLRSRRELAAKITGILGQNPSRRRQHFI